MEQGTIIKVENLFQNLPSRKKSLSSPGDSFRQVLTLIQSLSFRYPKIQFNLGSLKNKLDFISNLEILQGQMNEKDCRMMLASQITKLPIEKICYIDQEISEYKVRLQGIYTKIGSVSKTRDLILFINERLVECPSLKSAIDGAYKNCWNSIHEEEGGYYCFLALEMRRHTIDVNVHPSKKIVKFIFEREISERVSNLFERQLKEGCSIKDFSSVNISRLSLTNLKKVKEKSLLFYLFFSFPNNL
jgi:DNA mismatch repair protein MLH1